MRPLPPIEATFVHYCAHDTTPSWRTFSIRGSLKQIDDFRKGLVFYPTQQWCWQITLPMHLRGVGRLIAGLPALEGPT